MTRQKNCILSNFIFIFDILVLLLSFYLYILLFHHNLSSF